MKKHVTILGTLVCLLILVLLGSCAPGKYTLKANEELYGTWINKSYSGEFGPPDKVHPQKEVIDSNGYHVFRFVDDAAQFFEGAETITSKWTDSEGNIWYKTYESAWSNINEGKSEVPHFLYKLSKSATVRESVHAIRDTYTPSAFPTKIEPNDSSYLVYTRAAK
jgi:hypothetical protein